MKSIKLVAFFVLFLCSGILRAETIQHLRVVWHEDPAHEAAILWTTDKMKLDSTLYFDTVPRNGNLSQYPNKLEVKSRAIKYTLDFRHKAELKNLKASTKYYFVAVTNGVVSREYNFVTAPDDGRPFKLLFGGDSRTDREKRREINGVLKRMLQEDPSIMALVHGGDYVENGVIWKQWKEWLTDHNQITTTDDGRLLPVIPARGNHELMSPLFNEVFATPGGKHKKNFLVTKINDLKIITMNTNSCFVLQKRWLKDALEEAVKDSKWIVPNYHAPAFPGVKKPSPALKHWVPLFEKFQVDLVFESDGHVLKRTVPVYQMKENSERGITYVGEGGLGVKMREPKDYWYLRSPGYAASKYHILKLDVNRDQMVYTVNLEDGTIYDRMELFPKDRSTLFK